ncbi:MAG: DUF4832 domain-containing protein [Kiritimatiellae bacterium]|nr:DUF4832 domain-containing protein [Kiritimatiellia bacterium]
MKPRFRAMLSVLLFGRILCNAAPIAMREVTPKPADEILFNPGMGIFMSSSSPGLRIGGDEWYLKISNIVYLRCAWAKVQPREDATLEEFFDPLFDYWVKQRKMRLAFRVMAECVGPEDYVTPKWVFDKGVPGVRHTGKKGNTQIDPVFWDERYLAECDRFIAKLGRYLDGREGFEYIDMGLIGEWGEMHLGLHMPGRWTPPQLQETGFTRARYVGAYRRMIDAYARAFRHSRVFLNVGSDYPEINHYAALRGVHFRQDGLSPKGFSSKVGETFFLPYARQWVKGNAEFHSRFAGDELRAAIAKGLAAGISYLNTNIHWLPTLKDAPEETRRILTDAARRVGYRFVLTRVSVPEQTGLDGVRPARLPVEQEWQNTGVAPCGESFALRFTLADAQDRPVSEELLFPRTPTSHWWPDEPVRETVVLTVPPGTAPGTYLLKVAMVWPEQKRTILLGIDGRDRTDAYRLCPIRCARIRRAAHAYHTGFEPGESLWKASPGITVTRDDAVKHGGQSAIRVEGTQEGSWCFASFPLPDPVLPYSKYRLLCWMRVAACSRNRAPYLKAGLGDEAGKGIVNRLTGRYNTRTMDTWQELSVAFETTAATRGATLAIEKGTGLDKATVRLWLDDVKLERLEAP